MGWPPVEEGMSFDEIRLVGEHAAALAEHLIKVIKRVEIFIGNGLVRQRPQAFGGLDFRRICRQEHEFDAFGNLQGFGHMPAGLIEHEDDVLAGTGPHFSGEGRQDRAEQGGVDAINDEPDHRPGGRADKAIEIQPLVPVMAIGDRAAPAGCPDFAKDRLQAEPVFIKRPDFNRYRGLRAPEFRDPGLKFF